MVKYIKIMSEILFISLAFSACILDKNFIK